MRSCKLLGTPPAFQRAYQAHIEAWQCRANLMTQLATLVDSFVVDARMAADAAFPTVARRFTERTQQLASSEAQCGEAINNTWDDVRAASLAAGVDPAEFEMH